MISLRTTAGQRQIGLLLLRGRIRSGAILTARAEALMILARLSPTRNSTASETRTRSAPADGLAPNFSSPILPIPGSRPDAQRISQYTTIFGWLHTFSPQTCCTVPFTNQSSDQVLRSERPGHATFVGCARHLRLHQERPLALLGSGHFFKAGIDLFGARRGSFSSTAVVPRGSSPVPGWGVAQASFLRAGPFFRPVRNLTVGPGVRYDISTRGRGPASQPGVAWRTTSQKTKSVIHAAYNRLFSPRNRISCSLALWATTRQSSLRCRNVRILAALLRVVAQRSRRA